MRTLGSMVAVLLIVLLVGVRSDGGEAATCTVQQLQKLAVEYDPFQHRQIWGDDNRHEFGEEPNTTIRNNAFSVAVMVPRWALVDRGKNHVPRYELSKSVPSFGARLRRQEIGPTGNKCTANVNVCEGPYLAQPTPGYCTAFLVSASAVATAKHCVTTANLATNPYVVFGFWASQYGNARRRFMAWHVYEIDATNIRRCAADCAVVPLKLSAGAKMPVVLKPLPLQTSVTKTDRLYVVGHPNGLPMKIAAEAQINSDIGATSFHATLDTCHGNSGSPVFSASSHRVVGILTGGEPDFQLLHETGALNSYCWGLAHAADNSPGEFVTRVSALPALP